MSDSNTAVEIIPPDSGNSLPIATEIEDKREDQFLRNLFLGLSVKEAGITAGYSNQYSDSAIYTKFKSLKFQDKIRQYAIAHNVMEVPKVCDLYRIAVNQLHKEVSKGELENLGKLKHVTRQILEISKVVGPENGGTTVNYVNIEQLQAVVSNNIKDAIAVPVTRQDEDE